MSKRRIRWYYMLMVIYCRRRRNHLAIPKDSDKHSRWTIGLLGRKWICSSETYLVKTTAENSCPSNEFRTTSPKRSPQSRMPSSGATGKSFATSARWHRWARIRAQWLKRRKRWTSRTSGTTEITSSRCNQWCLGCRVPRSQEGTLRLRQAQVLMWWSSECMLTWWTRTGKYYQTRLFNTLSGNSL